MRFAKVMPLVFSVLPLTLFMVAEPAAAATPTQHTCTNPSYTTSGRGNGRTGPGIYHPGDSPYIVDNNMWNAAGYDITQTMNVCSHNSWYVEATTPADADTAVKTGPNVHVDYHNWCTGYEPPLSDYPKITSSYAGHGPNVGIYEYDYDIWLNGVASAGSSEVMIWTDNHGQRPSGSVVAANLTISGQTWDLWATSSNRYLAFVPTNGQAYPSGTLTLTDFFNYLIHQGRLASTSTLGQVDYGIEVVRTGGGTVRYDVTNFSITPPHVAIEGC